MGTADHHQPPPAKIEWDGLLPGAELSARVLMASGFALAPGQHVEERYRVERRLGEGGMGQVLAVSLLGTTDEQTFALKVVARSSPPDHSDPSEPAAASADADKQAQWFAELLRAEAAKQEVAARHGVVVARLFALVQLHDGSLGLRMELARGRSLEAQISAHRRRRDTPPNPAAAVRVVRKLLSQLRRLHEMVRPDSPFGFVHSDIKPGNVFVDDSDPSDLTVTLLDFGVATAGQAMANRWAAVQNRRKTLVLEHTGGTLGYVPPYHFSGRATPISDVYAALVILYELVALASPWELQTNSQRPSVAEVEEAMLAGPRPIRKVRPSISEEHAAALDAFFAREFGALNELAANTAHSLASGDEEVVRAVSERLRALARDYGARLDALHWAFAPIRREDTAGHPAVSEASAEGEAGGGDGSAVSRDALANQPTMLNDPLSLDTSSPMPGLPRRGTGGGGGLEWNTIPPDRARGNTQLVLPDEASLPPVNDAGMTWGDSLPPPRGSEARPTVPAGPARKPARSGGSGWVYGLIGLVLIGAGGVVVWRVYGLQRLRNLLGPPATTIDAGAPLVADHADALAPSAAVDAATAGPLATAEGDAGGAAVAVEGDAGATQVAAAPDAGAAAGATPRANSNNSGGAARAAPDRCRCIAPAPGVRVVAHGGSLLTELVLCTTVSPMPHRPGYFSGQGVIPEEFISSHASTVCRGGGISRFELTVLPYSTGRGNGSLFDCERAGGGGGEPSGGGGGEPAPAPAPPSNPSGGTEPGT